MTLPDVFPVIGSFLSYERRKAKIDPVTPYFRLQSYKTKQDDHPDGEKKKEQQEKIRCRMISDRPVCKKLREDQKYEQCNHAQVHHPYPGLIETLGFTEKKLAH